ncbi:PD-(D/E)XK nuclease family protein [Anaerosolibacter sp.]|uniref:PDDEXK-like family protein n=1 Tax=Anaerosolibacter sp. TaxID=1872527 RepID=UPI0039F05EC9
MTIDTDRESILQFIINNDNLEIVKAKLNRFNPFKILRIQDHEVRHSNVLAWIFNPSENHNFDDRLLKRFLLKVLLKPINGEIISDVTNIYDLQNLNLYDSKVFREKSNIDLLIVSDANKIVVLLENKVYSGEHSNQLERYLQIVEREYKDYLIIPILLTLDGSEASSERYFSASYEDVIQSIEFLVSNYAERTSQQVIEFIEHYISIIKEKYYMDNELKSLCKDIYLKNREVIDLIYSIGNEIDIEKSIDDFNQEFPRVEKVSSRNKVYWFLVEEFKKSKRMNDGWGAGYPVCYWFSEYYGKLKLTLEIGPFDDPRKRVEFLEQLEKGGIKIQARAKELGRKYTRIYTKTHPIKDWTDSDEITDVMSSLFKKQDLREIENKVIDSINQFNWDA